MSPIRTVESSPGHRVVERTCEGCGKLNASFGTGSLREALRTGDASKVKCWCGQVDGQPACVAEARAAA